jgi:hypothetical protein
MDITYLSLLIIRLEDVIVVKPWYIRKLFSYVELTGSIVLRPSHKKIRENRMERR